MYVHLYKHPLMSTRIHMYSLYLTCIEGIVRSSASASTACSCVMLSRDSDSCTRIFSLKPKALLICSLFLSLSSHYPVIHCFCLILASSSSFPFSQTVSVSVLFSFSVSLMLVLCMGAWPWHNILTKFDSHLLNKTNTFHTLSSSFNIDDSHKPAFCNNAKFVVIRRRCHSRQIICCCALLFYTVVINTNKVYSTKYVKLFHDCKTNFVCVLELDWERQKYREGVFVFRCMRNGAWRIII